MNPFEQSAANLADALTALAGKAIVGEGKPHEATAYAIALLKGAEVVLMERLQATPEGRALWESSMSKLDELRGLR